MSEIIDFVTFEPVLHALYNELPLWKQGQRLLDRRGDAFDPTLTFELTGDREDGQIEHLSKVAERMSEHDEGS